MLPEIKFFLSGVALSGDLFIELKLFLSAPARAPRCAFLKVLEMFVQANVTKLRKLICSTVFYPLKKLIKPFLEPSVVRQPI